MWLAAIVCLAYGVQTAAGFGSSLVCVTLGALVMPDIEQVLLHILPLSLLQTGWIVGRNRTSVVTPLLFGRVLPIMGAFMGAGFIAKHTLGTHPILKPLFGALVLGLATRELWRLRRPAAAPPEVSPWTSRLAIAGAGLVHGIYATGGPMLVYAIGREPLDQGQFRATLTSVWLTLNTFMVAFYAVSGSYDAAVLKNLAGLSLALPIGIFVGDKVHHHVAERTFRLVVFGLLGLAALALLLR